MKLSQSQLFNQPKPFYIIFIVEFWERFGYYGVQSILAVYMVKMLGLSERSTITLMAAFMALVYGLICIGGWLGDHILGNKRLIAIGTVVLSAGYALMAFSSNLEMLYIAMATIAVGNGLFKSNTTATLAYLYDKTDSRLEAAYMLFYMAVNIGSFVTMLITPLVATHFGWNIAFALSSVGLVIALLNYLIFQKWFKDYGSAPDLKPINKKNLLLSIIGIFVVIYLTSLILQHLSIAHITLALIGVVVIASYFWITFKQDQANRKKMLLAFILMIQAIVFYTLYSQTFTSLNFFAIHHVEKEIFGFTVQGEQYQSLNPFWIMILSPILAERLTKLGHRFPMTYKFTVGMFLASFAYFLLPLGILFANSHYLISVWWLVASYALQCVGELMIASLGPAMIAQLVPEKYSGFAMGCWLLTVACGSIIAGFVANLATAPDGAKLSPVQSLAAYQHVFMQIGIVTLIIATIMLIFASRLNKMREPDFGTTQQNLENNI